MSTLWNCFFVGIGGAAGTIARYLLGLLPVIPQSGFPLMTLMINTLGAFVIGLVAAFASREAGLDPHLHLLLKTGLCGGFTTFSTFSLESIQLFQSGKTITAMLYILLSILLGLCAILLAQALVQ